MNSSNLGTETGSASRDESGIFDMLGGVCDGELANALRDQLAESERLVEQMSLSWEERVEMSEEISKVSTGSSNSLFVVGHYIEAFYKQMS